MNFLNRKTVEDIDVTGKRVLVRCDYNVPFDSEGNITDTKRIDESIKTLRYLIDHNAKVIICSHRGRPKGTVKPELSLAPTIPYLSKVLGQQVQMATDVVGESAKALCSNLQEGQVMMLENVRFEKGEEANDPAFAKELASLADIYVNDAFGTSHRAHASTAGVAAYLPAVCGYLIQKELQVLGNALNHPARPFVAILGGAKVSDKIGVITALLDKIDVLIELASLADIYVNDAFGTSHRAHASTAGVAAYLPAVCGYLIQKELQVLGNALNHPARPFVAILGGAKVSDKIGVITALLDKIDVLIVGGGMAYTFTNALGYSIGNSLCEPDKLELAKDIMAKAKEKGVNFLIPVDNVIANKFAEDAQWQIVDSDQIPEGWMGLDIGPKSAEIFAHAIEHAGTVFWNGPLGVSEWKNFAEGTFKVAQALAHSDAYSIIGGGDSAAAVEKLGFAKQMSHISTGGGASLELIEGLELPGIACLMEKE